MPITPTYPGVYVTEIPSGVRPITGVATSITAFLGAALKGPVNRPTQVNGYADFERIFGGLWASSPMSFAVRDFFLNGGGQALIVRLVREDAQRAKIDVGDLHLVAGSEGAWSANLEVTIAAGSTDKDVLDKYRVEAGDLFTLSVVDVKTGDGETFPNVTLKAASPRFLPEVLAHESVLLDVVDPLPTTTPTASSGNKVTVEGVDGSALNDDSYTGTGKEAAQEGLYALEKADLFNLLCIPPSLLEPAISTSAGVYGKALAYCVKRRAMLIVDPPPTLNTSNGSTELTALGLNGTDARNAVLYFPRIVEPDPTAENRPKAFVPCGAMAGIMARTDASRGVWKAPAGLDAGLAGVTDLKVNLTNDENGTLNPLGVNCLRTFPVDRPGRLGRADPARRRPAGRRVQVRAGPAAGAVPGGVPVPRARNGWCSSPTTNRSGRRSGSTSGRSCRTCSGRARSRASSPRDAYFVKCDGETTTANDRNLGRVNIVVGFAPLRPGGVRRPPDPADRRAQSPREESSWLSSASTPSASIRTRTSSSGSSGTAVTSPASARSACSSAPPRWSSTARAATRAAAGSRRAAPSTTRSPSSAASPMTSTSSSGPTRSGTTVPASASEVSLKDFRKDIIIEVYNEAGQLAIAYKVFRCWVSEYQALPDLDANANAVAIQHIKLENEGWERDYDVPEPTEPSFVEPGA